MNVRFNTDLFIKILKSCYKVFLDSIEISDCVRLSSDGEQEPGFISVPDITTNTAMIINIKMPCYFVDFLWSLCTDVAWLVCFTDLSW